MGVGSDMNGTDFAGHDAGPGATNEALAAVTRLRDLLVDGNRLPAYVADSAADDLATIERALIRSLDRARELPMHIHRPEQMLRGE